VSANRYVALRQAEWRDILSLGETRVSRFRIVESDADISSLDARRLFAGAALGRLEDSARMVIAKFARTAPRQERATSGFGPRELLDIDLRHIQSFMVVEDRFLEEVRGDFLAQGLTVSESAATDLWAAWVADEGSRRAEIAGRRFAEHVTTRPLGKRRKGSPSWRDIADRVTGRVATGDPRVPLLWFLREQARLFDATAAQRKKSGFWLALPLAVIQNHPEGRDTDPKVLARIHRARAKSEKSQTPVDDAINKAVATQLRTIRRACPAVFDREFTPLVAAVHSLHSYRIQNQYYRHDVTRKHLDLVGQLDGRAARQLAAYLMGVELGLERVHQLTGSPAEATAVLQTANVATASVVDRSPSPLDGAQTTQS
jgi:hypothetical protein